MVQQYIVSVFSPQSDQIRPIAYVDSLIDVAEVVQRHPDTVLMLDQEEKQSILIEPIIEPEVSSSTWGCSIEAPKNGVVIRSKQYTETLLQLARTLGG